MKYEKEEEAERNEFLCLYDDDDDDDFCFY